MKKWLRDHGLTIVMFGCFALFLSGQVFTGWQVYNEEQQDRGNPTTDLPGYFRTGHIIEATFENWESEFLQMGAYVLFTVFLFQRGSAESKDPDKPDEDGEGESSAKGKQPPWPVRQGGWIRTLYEHSLTIALLAIFLLSFVLHALGGVNDYNLDQVANGEPTLSLWQFLMTPDFWFQSFQNWQSEFLAVGSLAVLSIFLRERGSPESKAVDAPHDQTGAD